MNFPIRVLCVIVAIAVSGCANINSIHRDNSLSKTRAEVVFTDAKQRGIISNPIAVKSNDLFTLKDGTQVPAEFENQMRICSEAAPDVFSAFATSAAGKASVDAATKSGSGAFSFASQESAATISRTQTINLLREAMFRTCERYLNGAITTDELIVQSARDQQMIVSTLAIEQLTGVFAPAVTALTSAANSSTGGPTAESMKLVADAKKASETTEKAANDADKAAKEAEDEAKKDLPIKVTTPEAKEYKTCEEVLGSKLDDDKKKKCTTAKEKRAEHKTLADKAKAEKEHYDRTKKMADQLAGTAASASGSSRIVPTAVEATCCSQTGVVARSVERIVESTFRFNEMQMACVVVMRRASRGETVDPAMKRACLDMLDRSTRVEASLVAGDLKEAEAIARESLNRRDLLTRNVLLCAAEAGPEEARVQSQIGKIADEANNLNARVFGGSGVRQLKTFKTVGSLDVYLETKGLSFVEALEAGAARVCGTNNQ